MITPCDHPGVRFTIVGPDCAAADRADALYESREYAAERARGRE